MLGCLKGLTCKHDREKVFTALRPLQGIRALRGPAKCLTVHNRGCGSIATGRSCRLPLTASLLTS